MRRLLRHWLVLTIVAMMLGAILLMRAPFLGWQVHTVVSSSMVPELNVGEVVVTRQVEPASVDMGDIIVFSSPMNGEMLCHRVIEVIDVNGEGCLFFRTKGDANQRPDAFLVPAQNVLGRVQFHTPVLAHVSSAMRSPLALIMLCV